MGLFGMSEAGLKKFATELEAKNIELNNKRSDIAREVANAKYERELLDAEKSAFIKERDDHLEEIKRIRDEIASANADLEKRRQEVVRLQATAKSGFVAEQEALFKEVIEKRIVELDNRETELDALAKRISDEMTKVISKEGDVAKRELSVTEREQKADAGFADKTAALAAEAKRQHEANLREANALKQRAEQLAAEKEELENNKEIIRQREKAVADSERERDAGYADERSALDSELNGKRVAWQNEDSQRRSALQKELADQKTKLLAQLGEEIAAVRAKRLADISASVRCECEHIIALATDEANHIREAIANERREWESERTSQKADLASEREANEKRAGELSALGIKLEGKGREIDVRERDLENRRGEINDEVSRLVTERKTSFDEQEAHLKEEIQRLRDSLYEQEEIIGLYDRLKRQLGDKDPEKVEKDLKALIDYNKKLKEELAQPNDVQQARIDALQKAVEEHKLRADEKEKELASKEAAMIETAALMREKAELILDRQSLERKVANMTAEVNELNSELTRLRAAYETPVGRESRCRAIEEPLFPGDKIINPPRLSETAELIRQDRKNNKEISAELKMASAEEENEWLRRIIESCEDYQIHFNERIVKAYHTALKTSEWSPLAVLAGVSGTGKSELPKLYSHFGGLYFEPLSVQPNWDSQESMLGFFNSIDNKFDAQPVLRFLAQSQKPWGMVKDGKDNEILYPGLQNAVCMVLLDEMNLAHPELYFAEFLSKLELRRGFKKKDIPSLPVKIGAGLKPYELPLGRNVLWTGTMNQDETTKSLSDKVLDRSIIIYFPRPTELKRRKVLNTLDNSNRGKILHRDTWGSWLTRDSYFTTEEIAPFKEFVEKINESLGKAGRAVGHRVWQSVEYYMANYPDIRLYKAQDNKPRLNQAMHDAFEDQIVQKIMPKLRGIDTRGVGGECLDTIRRELNIGVNEQPFNLDEDFDLAIQLGYGQFMWQSANYLKEESPKSKVHESNSDTL